MSTSRFVAPDHGLEGYLNFEYDCVELGVYLSCWFEYEPAEPGSAFEPAYPEVFSLVHAYLPGSAVDLAGVLRDELVQEINEWVYGKAAQVRRQLKEDWDE